MILDDAPQLAWESHYGRVVRCLAQRPANLASALAAATARATLLSDCKAPETFGIAPSPLPRNANGKLVKTTLRPRLQTAA